MLLALSLVSACSCIYLPDAQAKLEQARLVFSGEVIEIQSLESYPVKQIVTLKVNEHWKLPDNKKLYISPSSIVTITTIENYGANCGYTFQEDSYLVYAYLNEESEIATNSCSGTLALDEAQADLEQLGEGTKLSDEDIKITFWQKIKIFFSNLFN